MFNLLGLCLGHFHNTIGRRYLTAIKENRTLLRCGFESVCETYGNTAQKRCGIKVSVVKYGHG